MKKIIGILTISCAGFLSAQGSLDKGKIQLNAGAGVGTWGIPIYVGADYGLMKNISLGAQVSYTSFKENVYYGTTKHNSFAVSARGNYHFNELLKLPSMLDVYAGASVSYMNWNSQYTPVTSLPGVIPNMGLIDSGVYFNIQTGARYFFNDKFAVNVELSGTPHSGLVFQGKAGITYRIN